MGGFNIKALRGFNKKFVPKLGCGRDFWGNFGVKIAF